MSGEGALPAWMGRDLGRPWHHAADEAIAAGRDVLAAFRQALDDPGVTPLPPAQHAALRRLEAAVEPPRRSAPATGLAANLRRSAAEAEAEARP